MINKDKKSKIADILLEFYEEYNSNVLNRPMIPSIYADKISDSLQEEPVSVWHNMDEENPPQGSDICLLWPRDGIITIGEWNKNGLENNPYISKWAYKDDLLNLSNVERIVKDWKEPVSEELEGAAEQYAIESYPDEPSTGQFGTGDYEPYVDMSGQREYAVEAFKAGAKWQKKKDQEAVEIAREETLQEVKEKLLIMLNTSIDNKHFFEQLDDYIEELENEQ